MTECYKAATERIGFCVNSYKIWKDYIEFMEKLMKMKYYTEQEGYIYIIIIIELKNYE